MRDLLVVTPSRGRPGRLVRMLEASLSLAEAATDIAVGFDDDDPQREAYGALARLPAREHGSVLWQSGPRDTVSGWTNQLVKAGMGGYRAFASLSDDHQPRTPGWDRLLLDAIGAMGGTGIAYGNDMHQGQNLPTSAVVSADIVAKLGWMALPRCAHYHIDDVWGLLGARAGCLAYLPDVIIEHLHYAWGTAQRDETYASEEPRGPADLQAFLGWRDGGQMDADIAAVAALRRAA